MGLVGPESLKIQLRAAASREKTSNLGKAQVGTELRATMETLARSARKAVSSASQTMIHMPELHNLRIKFLKVELEHEAAHLPPCLQGIQPKHYGLEPS
jgi:hypothetical protein